MAKKVLAGMVCGKMAPKALAFGLRIGETMEKTTGRIGGMVGKTMLNCLGIGPTGGRVRKTRKVRLGNTYLVS